MLFNKSCPVCDQVANFAKIHRSFVEKHITRKEWNKFYCSECYSEVYAHRYKDIELQAGKNKSKSIA